MGSGSSPLSCRVFLPPPLLQAFPLLVARHVLPLLPSPAGLFIYSSVRDFPSPTLWHSGHPTLFATCLFCFYCLLVSFSFFLLWVFFFPGGYADLAQDCLWEYRVPLSSPCGPRRPKSFGRCCLVAAWGPFCFLCSDALSRLEVWRSQSFASSW
jgi:hypothetical protein